MQNQSPYQAKIKIYSDGADKASMLEMAKNPAVQGLTTNPSLMHKAGVRDYVTFSKEILSLIKDKPISLEVFADDFSEMERQANIIKTWGDNVYVKIPVTNSKGESALPLVKNLTQSGVKLNVTAILTIEQVQSVVDALIGGAPSLVSVFAGRIADTGRDPIPLMIESKKICVAGGKQIELLWASTREVFNIVQAELCGCDIITVPADMIKKLPMFNTPLEQVSLDTVKTFKKDSEAAGFKL